MRNSGVLIILFLVTGSIARSQHAPLTFSAPWTSPYHVDAASKFHFVNDEGTHLFILNKTAWAYFACKNPEQVLQRAVDQGVNVIRVALEGRPYYKQLGLDMWPWGGNRENPLWHEFNQDYWQQVEDRIRLAGEYGVGLDLVLYFTLFPDAADTVNQRAYWQYTLTRLAKYSNILIWEIANEYIENELFQDTAGYYLQLHDPFNRPVCSSDGTTDDAVWPDKSWMDVAVNHSCTSSTDAYPLDKWYLAVAQNTRAHGKPAFCNESGREKRHKNDDGVHRRKQGWLWCSAGCYWTWHSWDGCEGIDDIDYYTPGQEFLKPMADYFRAMPFYRLAPNYTVVTIDSTQLVSVTLADAGRNLISAYVCSKTSGDMVTGVVAALRLPDGEYLVKFKSPVNLAVVEEKQVISSGLKKINMLALPAFKDDLIIRIEKVLSAEKTKIPGTE
ncbi:MAG TPA: DUF4038 domain-containing protein [bacterium]|nr:DUF4038 domain-containing protein [bacterium]HPN45513.1 DUF4038 domain-containing protein [bacterium]